MDEVPNNGVADKNAEASFIAWYEDVVAERVSMLEAEEGYKKRVKELENNNLELLKAFEESQNEIKHVRTKYEPKQEESSTELAYLEPYDKVLADRERLKKDKADLKARLEEAEHIIKELKLSKRHSATLSTRPVDSSSSEITSESLTTSEDFNSPIAWSKHKHKGVLGEPKGKHKSRVKTDETNSGNKPKLKRPRPKSKLCYLITGKDKIISLENENSTLRMKIKSVQHENEMLQLQIDSHAKKINAVQNASRAYVKSLKKLNHAHTLEDLGTLSPHHTPTQESSPRGTEHSYAKSYRSMFVARKLTHKMSSVSLPAINRTERNEDPPLALVDRGTLMNYSLVYSPRSVQSDRTSSINKQTW